MSRRAAGAFRYQARPAGDADHHQPGARRATDRTGHGGPTPQTTSSNRPLRGQKGQVYEGGIRIPFVMRWSGHLRAGTTYEQPVIALDIFPTCVAAASGTLPGKTTLDGVNLLPHLTRQDMKPPHEALYWRFGNQHAIRAGDWKLVRRPAGPRDPQEVVELYNLADDISEANDLSKSQPEKVKQMASQLERWESELAVPLWRTRGVAVRAGRTNTGESD